MLELDGEALGKPASSNETEEIWRRLSGRRATLNTGHCLIDTATGQRRSRLASSIVEFGAPSAEEVATYAATEEPFALAGAFSIEGLSGPFVRAVHGSPSNVLGLSLPTFGTCFSRLVSRSPICGGKIEWEDLGCEASDACCSPPPRPLLSIRRGRHSGLLAKGPVERAQTLETDGVGHPEERRSGLRQEGHRPQQASLHRVTPPRHAQPRFETSAKRALGEPDMTGDLSHACGVEILPGPGQRTCKHGVARGGQEKRRSLSRASETNDPTRLKYESATGSEADRLIGQRPA